MTLIELAAHVRGAARAAPDNYLAVSPATTPATADLAQTAELLTAFQEISAPLSLRTAASAATLLGGLAVVRAVVRLAECLESQIPVPGVAGLGTLP